MGAATETKSGYKKTQLGWIPDHWSIKSLDSLGVFSKGKGIPKSEVIERGIPAIRYGEIYTKHDFYIKKFTSFINKDSSLNSRKLIQGDLLFAGSGETNEDIGKCVAFTTDTEAYAGGDIIILREHKEDPKFMGFLLNATWAQRQTYKFGQGHSVVHIYSSSLKNLIIPLPPLPEQKKIADILSTWDSAIETTQALIENLKLRKKGLMQQLLTGKKRLPGFSGEWEEVKLSKIGEFLKGKGIPKKELVDNGIPCIRYGELYTKHHSVVNSCHSFINEESAKLSTRLEFGDILFACSGETLNEIGKSAAFISKDETYAGGDIIILRQASHSALFLGYLFDTNDFIRKRRKFGQGQSVLHIYKSGLEKIEIGIPDFKEQIAIAQVFTQSDIEINQTQNYLDQLQEQKKGLMQQLLTGQKRVKV